MSSATTSAGYVEWTGTERKPAVTVTLNGQTLKQGADYTVSFKNNIAVGTGSYTITGVGGYTGTAQGTFTIGARHVKHCDVTLPKSSYTYTGSAIKPKPTVTFTWSGKTQTLKEGTDYTLSYSNNTKAGTATVTITGKGSYRGTLSKTFTIIVD